MSKMIRKAVSVALLASVALPMSAAMAASLYGGGATFPAVPYVGPGFKTPNPDARLSTDLSNTAPTPTYTQVTIDSSSIFGLFSSNNSHSMSYCQTGSGTGKNVLTGVTAPGGDCRDFSVGQLAFSAPQVNYVGTDSPITSTDYASFNTNRASATAIVQFPTLAGSIALPFQHSGFSGTLNLSVAQVCGIFRGTINNWSTLGLPAKTIKIVYRTDNSGTSFSFTNFLAARCNAPNGGPIANRPDGTAYWQTNQGYAASVPSLPAGAIGASGNNNVVAAVFNPLNDGAIGYADPGDVLATPGAKWALVNSADPMSFTLPALANADLQVGQVMSPTGSTANGLPSLSPAPTAAANLPSLLVVRPNLAVTSGYPIFAITYLGAAKTSNGATNAPALRCLGHFIYNHSGVAGCTLGRPIPSSLPAGYSYIDDSVLAVRTKLNTAINSIAP